jgi:chromate reductase
MRVLAISGSLRRDSYNTGLVLAAAEVAPEGVEVVVYDGLREIPPFDQDAEESAPATVEALKRAIDEADALLFATPEYNGSIPGVLKNAIDWASRPFATNPLRNKPAAVVGASTGMFGAVWAQAELRKVLGLTGARVLDMELPIGRAHESFSDGEVGTDEIREKLADIIDALQDAVSKREALTA